MIKLLTFIMFAIGFQYNQKGLQETEQFDSISGNEVKTKINGGKLHKIINEKYQLKNENLIFFFETERKKILTVCVDKNEEYIVFRFGTSEKVEIQYPESKDKNSFGKFEYTGWQRHGGAQNEGMSLDYLTFSVDNFKYIIYEIYHSIGNDFKIGIKILNTDTDQTTDIKGIYKTKKGTLSDFRNDDRIKKGDELYD